MTIRDIKCLIELINEKKLGLELDSSICADFEKKQNILIIFSLPV